MVELEVVVVELELEDVVPVVVVSSRHPNTVSN